VNNLTLEKSGIHKIIASLLNYDISVFLNFIQFLSSCWTMLLTQNPTCGTYMCREKSGIFKLITQVRMPNIYMIFAALDLKIPISGENTRLYPSSL